MHTVLTIAGFDPSSGAGVTADLAVFAAHGLFGTSAITGLTVQSTIGVRSVHPVDPTLLRETLDELEQDLPPDGIKIGMLASAACVTVVVDFLRSLRGQGRRFVTVLDPVLASTSGRALLDDAGLKMLADDLIPLVDWATPNVNELAVLCGLPRLENGTGADIVEAGKLLRQRCGEALSLVLTGGESNPPDDLVLWSAAAGPVWLRGERVETQATHGTGCAFASALLSRLVLGADGIAAAQGAKAYVAEAMRSAAPRGRGRGPIDHFWPLTRR